MNRSKILTTIASLLLACALYAQAQTKAPSSGVIHREGEPACLQIAEENKAMDRAVETAQKTVKKFIAVLRSPKGNQGRFAVKKPIVEGDKVEHIWLTEVSFDGHLFHGKVDNEPVDIKGARLGQEVSVAANEISDWMYVEDGKLVGGYTIAAMLQHMTPAEKQQFETDADCQITEHKGS